MKFVVFSSLLLSLIVATPLYAQEHISHGRFKDVTPCRPSGEATEFVLLLSGDGGLDKDAAVMAETLIQQGAMVAGISLPQLLANFEQDTDT